MLNSLALVFCFCMLFSMSFAQEIATIEVKFSQHAPGLDLPVETSLDDITSLKEGEFYLAQIRNGKVTPVAAQVISHNNSRSLHWIVETQNNMGGILTYRLIKGKAPAAEAAMKISKDKGALTIRSDAQDLLRYQFEKLEPPSGVDRAYGRSGFIHPLWSPKGKVLTRIQPPDHYHHYGIWNPWTHVLYEGDTVDFWNLNKKEGTVRFARFSGTSNGPVLGEYTALHEHVVFKKDGGEEVALNELQGVRVYRPSRDYYIADISIDLSCAAESPFLILAYRYAGLGWRTTEKWDNTNSTVLTSENRTRKDADGTTARWCLVQGKIDDAHAGVLMMSYPANYNHPEPLRIWPENQYERGDMFANFSPTKNKDWKLQPGKAYSLRYRLVVFDGTFDKNKAEAAWQDFAVPPKITVQKK